MKHCNCDTEINRDGSGQLQRYLKALDPAYAPIDGRSTEDLLVFAKKYAAQIRFYDIPESKLQDDTAASKVSWREFFRRDMTVIAASIAVTDTAAFKKEYDEINERLQVNSTWAVYNALYAPIVGMMTKIDHWYTVAIPENPLYADLQLAITSDLKAQAQKIIAYKEGFKFVDPSADLETDFSSIENKALWGLNETIAPEAGIYTGSTAAEKIINASLFTEDIFHAFYNFLNKLVSDSEKYLHFAMEQYPAHQPHMALFITFLQLFNKAQQQMNGLTGRMLDFYFKDVLHLDTKPSMPDKVHIVFELAKEIAAYPLDKDTSLKAGADNSGTPQVYKTIDSLVINQAKVAALKTIFVQKTPKTDVSSNALINTIYARPVANSADGFGEKFDSADTKWPTFGIGSRDSMSLENTCEKIELLKVARKANDETKIGFAIASPQLLLQGGKRLVEIGLNDTAAALFAKQAEMTDAHNLFEIWFTGDKGWFKVAKVMTATDQDQFKKFLPLKIFNPLVNIEACYYLVKETNSLFIYLPPSAAPVIEYDKKLHTAYTYGTAQPVMQILLNPVLDLDADIYKKIVVDDLSLKINVGSIMPDIEGSKRLEQIFKEENISITADEFKVFARFPADGLNKLVVQNESQGLLPLGQPFDPFTAYPATGKSFYIGSNEVFNKPLGQLAVALRKTMDINIKEMTVAGRTEEFAVSIRENRNWVDLATANGNDFSQQSLKSNILFEQADSKAHIHYRNPILPVTALETDTEKGFIKITTLVQINGQNFLEESQNRAHTLEIKELSVSYESTLARLEIGTDEFYHVYPFGNTETYISTATEQKENARTSIINNAGYARLHAYLLNNAFTKAAIQKNNLLVNAGNILLPQFTYLSPYRQYNTISAQNVMIRTGTNILRDPVRGGDAIAEKLVLSASGLADNLSGADNQYSATEQEEGMLFIGLVNAAPQQMISMLFQFAEGSAADEDNDPPEIHWSYCTNNEWRPMKQEHIVSDGTAGFQTTGIIKVEIPADATHNNSIIGSGLYWICASVTENSNRIPMLIDIVTQAVLARFEDNNNDQSHFDKALPLGSISKLSVAVSEVAKVNQPFASFDGKHKEIGKEFYTRVSERLRHKARAITAWDYEHLVLDRFPSVYKIKCITHTDPNCLCTSKAITSNPDVIAQLRYTANGSMEAADEAVMKSMLDHPNTMKVDITAFNPTSDIALVTAMANRVKAAFVSNGFAAAAVTVNVLNGGTAQTVTIKLSGMATVQDNCCGPQIAPGHVLLVPISNLKNRNAVNLLQPKTSRRVLLDIAAFIKKRTSPFVHVHVKNPVYEQVLVFFRVKFRAGYDKGFYMKELNEAIVHYLTPWAFDEVAEVKFGQKIYASAIINFIEERIYVDFITDFLMLVCRKGCCDDVVEAVKDSTDDDNILAAINNCCDMEMLLQEANFAGEIIAKPSTARSLLVSAPRHIIIPYQEPILPTACEKRKLNIVTANTVVKDELHEIITNGNTTPVMHTIPTHPVTGAVKPAPKTVVKKPVKKNHGPSKKK